MRRKIIFKDREGRFDVPCFILSDNESLFVVLSAPALRKGKYYLCVKHGTQKMRFEVSDDKVIELPCEFLKNSCTEPILFDLEYRDVTGMVLYKKYYIEPLEVQDLEQGTQYFASVQKVENENLLLREELQELKNNLEEISIKVDKLTDEGVPLLPATDILENQN